MQPLYVTPGVRILRCVHLNRTCLMERQFSASKISPWVIQGEVEFYLGIPDPPGAILQSDRSLCVTLQIKKKHLAGDFSVKGKKVRR